MTMFFMVGSAQADDGYRYVVLHADGNASSAAYGLHFLSGATTATNATTSNGTLTSEELWVPSRAPLNFSASGNANSSQNIFVTVQRCEQSGGDGSTCTDNRWYDLQSLDLSGALTNATANVGNDGAGAWYRIKLGSSVTDEVPYGYIYSIIRTYLK